MQYFRFPDYWFITYKKNSHNSRTSNGFGIKLGLATKIDKRNKTTSKILMMASCQEIVMPLLFFQFAANLEESISRIPDA